MRCRSVLNVSPGITRPKSRHVANVHLKKGEGGLPHPSELQCEDIQPIPKSVLEPEPLGGPISEGRLLEVRRAVLIAIGFVYP
jgi:mRNA-degrading endonuclease toxin of MazEF toxin-antitoxin module